MCGIKYEDFDSFIKILIIKYKYRSEIIEGDEEFEQTQKSGGNLWKIKKKKKKLLILTRMRLIIG